MPNVQICHFGLMVIAVLFTACDQQSKPTSVSGQVALEKPESVIPQLDTVQTPLAEPEKSNPINLDLCIERAKEFWQSYQDENPFGYKPWKDVPKEILPGLSEEDMKVIRARAQKVAKQKVAQEAIQAWRWACDDPSFSTPRYIKEAEAYRTRASLSREELGMTDAAIGKLLVQYHAYMAQQLWSALFNGSLHPNDERKNQNRWQLILEVQRHSPPPLGTSQETPDKFTGGHTHDELESETFKKIPLKHFISTINYHLEKADLSRENIGMTNERLAQVVAAHRP